MSIGDVNRDGFGDLIFGGGPGGAPRIFILQGSLISAGNISGATSSPIANFFAGGNVDDRGGVRVAVSNSDGDTLAEVFAASGLNVAGRIRVYRGFTFTGSGEPAGAQIFDVVTGPSRMASTWAEPHQPTSAVARSQATAWLSGLRWCANHSWSFPDRLPG